MKLPVPRVIQFILIGEYKNHALRLVDTAGMRKKSHITEKLETVSVKDSLNSIKYAQIVMLVMDATEALERQDLRLAGHVIDEGRAIIIVVNKWDLVKDKKAFSEELDYLVGKTLGDITGVPIVKISALNDTKPSSPARPGTYHLRYLEHPRADRPVK